MLAGITVSYSFYVSALYEYTQSRGLLVRNGGGEEEMKQDRPFWRAVQSLQIAYIAIFWHLSRLRLRVSGSGVWRRKLLEHEGGWVAKMGA